MIIDLLNKLIGRLIELQNVRKKGRREILDVYIDPLFQEFETIHKLYVDSFRNYRKALSEPKCSVEQLLEKVQEERLFSQAQRSKLMHLVNATRDSSDDDDLKSFCTQIHSYLVFTHDDDQSFEGGSVQRWYHAFVRLVGSIDGDPLPSHSYLEPPWNYAKPIPMLRELNKWDQDMVISLKSQRFKKRDAAIRILDGLVASMQDHHAQVCHYYAKLRTKLTK